MFFIGGVDLAGWYARDRGIRPALLHSPQQFTELFRYNRYYSSVVVVSTYYYSLVVVVCTPLVLDILLEIFRGGVNNGKYIFMSFIVEIRAYCYIYFISDIITFVRNIFVSIKYSKRHKNIYVYCCCSIVLLLIL